MFVIGETEVGKAIENARQLHPKVKMILFGEYLVSGSRSSSYIVRCYRDRGLKIVDCGCPTRDGVACKHGMAAVSLHIGLAARRRAA